MSKLLFIGVDALDAVQVELFADSLTNISHIRKEAFYTQFPSVWPPDSETAWASIYTGWNPARHGIFQFVDPLQKTSSYIARERDNTILREHTFWDIAGAAGRQVRVLFPHIGYPSWDVNGLMITRASLDKHVSAFPPQLENRYNLNDLNNVKGMPGRQRQEYLDANYAQVERQLELTLQILKEGNWDLFFSYWSALDLIQHQFWAYCDPTDPTFPGETPFYNVIRDFYILHDEVIGKLLAEVDDDTTVLVMSDHGHGMRPTKIFNINRLLRERGLLFLQGGSAKKRAGVLKNLRNTTTHLISKYELGGLASTVLKHLPWAKKIYMSVDNVDWDRTVACTTDMSGIKAYSYGGIRIIQQNLNGCSYESVRDQIIGIMQEVCDPNGSEQPIVQWIKKREELYEGPYLDEYPDLVFELQLGYGAGWDATGPLFDISHSHSLYPGSHIQSNAVFMLLGPDGKRVTRPPTSLMDVAPTVLDILNVPIPNGLDGASILELKEKVKV